MLRAIRWGNHVLAIWLSTLHHPRIRPNSSALLNSSTKTETVSFRKKSYVKATRFSLVLTSTRKNWRNLLKLPTLTMMESYLIKNGLPPLSIGSNSCLESSLRAFSLSSTKMVTKVSRSESCQLCLVHQVRLIKTQHKDSWSPSSRPMLISLANCPSLSSKNSCSKSCNNEQLSICWSHPYSLWLINILFFRRLLFLSSKN